MARETLEAQAAAIRNILRGGTVPPAVRPQLQSAEQTLNAMVALRQKCLVGPGETRDDDFSDLISEEIIKLLHLPTDE